jgi:beta-glucanase (GH16 family)
MTTPGRGGCRHWLSVPLVAAGLAVGLALAPSAEAAIGGSFSDGLDSLNSSRWYKADGYSNGGVFNSGWRGDHVTFGGGAMTLTLDNASCPSGCSGKPYASGEFRTTDMYSYGRFETTMMAARGSGVVSSFFTYTGSSDNQPWDEIDVEILGKNTTQAQLNYFTNGTGGHEKLISLGFDAASGYHRYGFEWKSDTITWFVDGKQVHQENGSRGALPTHPQRIMTNLWPGTGVDSWLGPFTYSGPLTARYDSISYTQF